MPNEAYGKRYYGSLHYIDKFKVREKWIRGIIRYAEHILGSKLVGKRALDCGCGLGYSIPVLLSRFKELFLLDISEYAIKFIKENILNNLSKEYRNRIHLMVHDIQEPPKIERVNTSFCLAVLEHLRFPERAIKNIYDILTRGGIALFTTPSTVSIFKYKDPTHVNEKSSREWYEIFKSIFDDVKITPIHYLPFTWRAFNSFYFFRVPERLSCELLIIAQKE